MNTPFVDIPASSDSIPRPNAFNVEKDAKGKKYLDQEKK
jgi:hypothetical protein